MKKAETEKSFNRGKIKKSLSMYTREKMELHRNFFDCVISELKIRKTTGDIVAILHLLPDAIPFTEALSKIGDIKTIIPKPKSISKNVLNSLQHLPIDVTINRDNSFEAMCDLKKRTVFLDIGGYFAYFAGKAREDNREKFAGVVEDTENGFQKYLRKGVSFPFISVARSPLKYNEDIMVGQAIAYSAEAILREQSIIINGLNVGVIGYGKIGLSVAKSFSKRNGNVSIFDTNSVLLTHAVSAGFSVVNKDTLLLKNSLICLATGNLSMRKDDFKKLKKGAIVFSVTSSDDEMDMRWVDRHYKKERIASHITKYTLGDHYFYILNNGNAINFIHGTTMGDFILLVQAELLVAAFMLLNGKDKEYEENKGKIRNIIASVWLDIFRCSEYKNSQGGLLHRNICEIIDTYLTKYTGESIHLLKEYIEKTPRSISRANTPGHITASGLVIKDDKVLLIFHKVLQKYLQPGGHIEDVDSALFHVAQREILEEVGIKTKPHPIFADVPVHIDIHKIPKNNKKKEPEHFHYDFMFVFLPEDDEDVVLQAEEVSGYKWVSLDYKFKDKGLHSAIRKIKKKIA